MCVPSALQNTWVSSYCLAVPLASFVLLVWIRGEVIPWLLGVVTASIHAVITLEWSKTGRTGGGEAAGKSS